MGSFAKFIYFNLFAYGIYWAIDKVFTFFNLYSSPNLGQDLFTMPSAGDLKLIILNVVLSTAGATILMKWFWSKIE